MKVLVTGATGFTGSYTVPLLLAAGMNVRCFVRPTSDRSLLRDKSIEWFEGDIADIPSLEKGLANADTLINITSLGFGHAEGIVTAAVNAGVKRAIFISTTALFTKLNAPSKRVRQAAEKAICDSDLNYTILRPTMIYGSSRDRNMCRLIDFIQRSPFIPIAGDGKHLQQPVYVEDVGQAIVKCLLTVETAQKSYNIAGATVLTYNEVIETISRLSKRSVVKFHLPLTALVYPLRLCEGMGLRLPIKAEQLERLNEDKVFSYQKAADEYGYAPRSFEEGIQLELAEMRRGAS